jgi:hypothetical protein
MQVMNDTPTAASGACDTNVWSRRRFLSAFLSLAAYLHLIRPSAATVPDKGADTVLHGRWLLKRSDLP